MLLVSFPDLCWSGFLQHCTASADSNRTWAASLGAGNFCGTCSGVKETTVPKIIRPNVQVLLCTTVTLASKYFGMCDVWSSTASKAGISNTAQTKNSRSEQEWLTLVGPHSQPERHRLVTQSVMSIFGLCVSEFREKNANEKASELPQVHLSCMLISLAPSMTLWAFPSNSRVLAWFNSGLPPLSVSSPLTKRLFHAEA